MPDLLKREPIADIEDAASLAAADVEDVDADEDDEPRPCTIDKLSGSALEQALEYVREHSSDLSTDMIEEDGKQYALDLGIDCEGLYFNVGWGYRFVVIRHKGSLDLKELLDEPGESDVPFLSSCPHYAEARKALAYATDRGFDVTVELGVSTYHHDPTRTLEVSIYHQDDGDLSPRLETASLYAKKLLDGAFESLVSAIEAELLDSLQQNYDYHESEEFLKEEAEALEYVFDTNGDYLGKLSYFPDIAEAA